MPKILFAGGRLDSVRVLAGAPIESTTGAARDATYVDASIRIAEGDIVQADFTDTANAPVTVVTGETAYFHWEDYYATTSSGTVGALLRWLVDASGNPWLALRWVSTGNIGLYYNSGTGGAPVWTQIGANITFVSGLLYVWDIKLTLGSPHSQILCAEGRSTVNGKVKYARATGAGANTAWTGVYTDVNEAVNSDATVNSATTAGLRQTYPMTNVTVPAGYVIGGVFHFLRGKNDGAAPSNIKSSLRRSATNYDAATDMPGIGTSFGPLLHRYDVDPSTGVVWTQAGWNEPAQAGFLSVT